MSPARRRAGASSFHASSMLYERPGHREAGRQTLTALCVVLRTSVMTFFTTAGVPADQIKDLSPIPDELELFARIEGLVGEEAALLTVPREHRRQEQHERLRAISDELDRIWASLRERAEGLGLDSHPHSSGSGTSRTA